LGFIVSVGFCGDIWEFRDDLVLRGFRAFLLIFSCFLLLFWVFGDYLMREIVWNIGAFR